MSYFDILAPVYKIPAIWFKESRVGIIYLFILSYNAFSIIGCTHKPIENIGEMEDPVQQDIQYTFPPFITPTDQYYEYSIGETPAINTTSYLLTVSGAIENPRSYTLEELKALKMIDKTVTIECIHNPENGNLISTAIWKGFSLVRTSGQSGIERGRNRCEIYLCRRLLYYARNRGYPEQRSTGSPFYESGTHPS